jgi:hypothetical protein
MSWLRKPPLNQSRWSWYVEPWWDGVLLRLKRRRQNRRWQKCCGVLKPRHRLDCSRGY